MSTQDKETGVGKNGVVSAVNPAFVDEGGELATMENVVRAETAKYLAGEQIVSGTDTFRHERQGIQVDNQTVIRSNFDLIYSYGVFDVSNGLTITVPEYDLYHIVQVYDENAVTIGVVYAGETLELKPVDCTFGHHVYLFMRTEQRSLDEKGMDELHSRQDAVEVFAGSSQPYESAVQYDVASFNKLRDELIARSATEANAAQGFVTSLDQITSPSINW